MSEEPDYELLKFPEEALPPEPFPAPRRWIAPAVIIIAVGVGVGGYWLSTRRSAPTPASPPNTAGTKPAETQVRPLGGQPEAVAVPPLDESDAVVRDLVRRITSHPAALKWLTTGGLIRTFAVVVENVVDGSTPARHLPVLRPTSPFQVVKRSGQLFIDDRSYNRYDGIADAAASIDAAGAARVYATLKPRIEDAYAELGLPPGSFDRALERGVIALLQTPVIDRPVRVEPKGGVAYQYADPALEELTAAQKQLLRTGPRNVRIIQSALRQLALALGIPPERLPTTR